MFICAWHTAARRLYDVVYQLYTKLVRPHWQYSRASADLFWWWWNVVIVSAWCILHTSRPRGARLDAYPLWIETPVEHDDVTPSLACLARQGDINKGDTLSSVRLCPVVSARGLVSTLTNNCITAAAPARFGRPPGHPASHRTLHATQVRPNPVWWVDVQQTARRSKMERQAME